MIAWEMLRKQYAKLPKPLQQGKNENELWVQVGNSKITLKGAENEDSLRGVGLNGIVCDEVASFKNWRQLWSEVLRPALADKQGWAWFISTPKGYNHFYDLFNQETRDTAYKSFHATSYDNPFLPRDEIEVARNQLTEDAFAQEWLADFRKFVGLIYPEFDRRINIIEPFDLPNFWSFYRAMDFGAVNPTVCLWIAVDTNDNVYVFNEYYQTGQTAKFNAEVILAETKQPILVTWGDPSAEQAQLDYAGYGLTITPATKIFTQGQDWVKSGIIKVQEMLKLNDRGKPRLYIFRNCLNTIREFESYRWLETKEAMNSQEKPVKADDHCLDALRYFAVSWMPAGLQRYQEPITIKTNPYTGY